MSYPVKTKLVEMSTVSQVPIVHLETSADILNVAIFYNRIPLIAEGEITNTWYVFTESAVFKCEEAIKTGETNTEAKQT